MVVGTNVGGRLSEWLLCKVQILAWILGLALSKRPLGTSGIKECVLTVLNCGGSVVNHLMTSGVGVTTAIFKKSACEGKTYLHENRDFIQLWSDEIMWLIRFMVWLMAVSLVCIFFYGAGGDEP